MLMPMTPCAGSQPQKGITTYALAGNRQRPLAGVMTAAIFNNWRRFRAQVLYFAPPLIIAYTTMKWAIEKYVDLRCYTFVDSNQSNVAGFARNEYYNSKKGIAEMGAAE